MPPKRQTRGNRNVSLLFSFGPQVRCFWFSWGISADPLLPANTPREDFTYGGWLFLHGLNAQDFPASFVVIELRVL